MMQEIAIKSEKAIKHLRLTKFIVVFCEKEKRVGDVRVVDSSGRKIGEGIILMKTWVGDNIAEKLKEYIRGSGYDSVEEWLKDIGGEKRGWLYLVKIRRIFAKRYSKDEEELIRKYYRKKGARWIAERINRSVESVIHKARRLEKCD